MKKHNISYHLDAGDSQLWIYVSFKISEKHDAYTKIQECMGEVKTFCLNGSKTEGFFVGSNIHWKKEPQSCQCSHQSIIHVKMHGYNGDKLAWLESIFIKHLQRGWYMPFKLCYIKIGLPVFDGWLSNIDVWWPWTESQMCQPLVTVAYFFRSRQGKTSVFHLKKNKISERYAYNPAIT